MTIHIHKKPITIAVGLALIGQLNSVNAIAAEDTLQLEEVVVTARRKAENLQDTPVSVTAFTSSDIEKVGITDITHLSELTPNLVIQPNLGGNDGTLVCMRGLCRTDFTITEDPMVGVYLDGIYIGKSIGSLFDVAELERVEVLRGPQGTLYGKNTLGGAVILHTRKPSGEFGAKASVTAGNYGRLDGKAYIEFPIVDSLAASVSVLSKNRDPFVENTLGDDRWDEDNLAGHGALRWTPSETTTIDYAYDWQKKRETPPSPQITSAEGHYIHPVYGIPIGLGDRYAQDVRPNREDTVHAYGPSSNDLDLTGHGLTMAFDLGDAGVFEGLVLKSITGYREIENDLVNNATGASSPYIVNHDIFELDSTSQEFQLSGAAADGYVDFVLGLFYFNEKGDYSNDQTIDAFGSHLLYETGIDNTSKAIFGEVTLNFTEQWAASFGLRYTDEEREQSHIVTTFNDPNGAPIPGGGSVFFDSNAQTYKGALTEIPTKVDETNVSPRISVNYKINDDMMTYATYARGFKSGGFNARSSTPLQWGPYEDMQVDSYELGFKSNWMDNRVKFNITGFYEDITDAQVQINAVDADNAAQGGFSVVVQNAAEATVIGLETELIVLITEGLDISAGYGYTDAEYDEFVAIDPITGDPADISDDRAVEFTPKNNYNVSINYVFPQFTESGNLTARLDWSGQSAIRFTPKISGNDDIRQESYDVLNARVAFEDLAVGDNSFGVALWVRNMTDEEYKIGGYEVDAGDPAYGGLGRTGINQWGEPRTYGLDIIYRYGSML